jgi:hypothetical protein
MASPTPRHDALAGAGVTTWVVGMGLAFGADAAVWQATGIVLWAGGLVVAGGVAAHAYLTRSRVLD